MFETGLNPGDRLNDDAKLENFLNVRPPTGDPRESFDGEAFRLDGLDLYGKGMGFNFLKNIEFCENLIFHSEWKFCFFFTNP